MQLEELTERVDICFKIVVIKAKACDVNSFFQYLLFVLGILYPFLPVLPKRATEHDRTKKERKTLRQHDHQRSPLP